MKKLNFDTLLMIFAVIVMTAAVTWLIPGGEYQRQVKEGKTLVVPDSFSYTESNPQGIADILSSPFKGFVKASEIIAFLFLLGGSFSVILRTGAITVAIQHMAKTFAQKPHLQKYFIPGTMLIFSLAGTTFGMAEEVMLFIPLFIPLAISLGYDSITGTAIPFLGAAAGFAGSTFNPFTVGIAQSIAEVPLYSGLEYRIVIWCISTAGMIFFVARYAKRVKADPSVSPVYAADQERRHTMHLDTSAVEPFTLRYTVILLLFFFSLAALVYGVLAFGWWLSEIAALFLALGILSGVAGRLKPSDITASFRDGAKDMVGVAMIIACARAILVIATEGRVLDVLLHACSGLISSVHPVFAAQMMFVVQGIINFFVHSGSGQAALTMPIMAPLADVLGLTRQTAVLAFQFGEGWINPILPTSGLTMGVLGLARIQWNVWFRWMLPIQIFFFIVALLLLIPPVLLHWQ
ncbi:MAG: putative basic amino acid antiporter YfcC [Bacteroidetes bacterium]|nr:MAG: putative basic amino acid antiporter YfcC [Bacteroidota bacterium]